MARIVLRSFVWDIIGLIVVPIATFFLVLIAAHVFDPRCGTPGDSGGCEMGSATAAIAMALPGLAFGFLLSLVLGLRRRRNELSGN